MNPTKCWRAILCLAVAVLAVGCAEMEESELSLEIDSKTLTAKKATSNPLETALNAVKSGDLKQVERVFRQSHLSYDGPISLQQGVISDYLEGDVAAVIRHHSVATPIVLFTIKEKLSAQLYTIDGDVIEVPIDHSSLREGGLKASIDPLLLSKQGVLRIQIASNQQGNSTSSLLLPVLDEQWDCATVDESCSVNDYACFLKAHETCFGRSLDVRAARENGASPEEQLSTYVEAHGGLTSVTVTPGRQTNTWSVKFDRPSFWTQGSGLRTFALAPDGRATPLTLSGLVADTNHVQAQIQTQTQLAEGSILVVDARPKGKGIIGLGVAQGLFKSLKKTWSIKGCIRFLDDVNAAATTRPVANAKVRWSGKAFGLYAQWTSTRTGADGCFSMTKRKNRWKRYLKLDLAFDDGLLRIRQSFSFSDYFRLWESPNKLSHGAHNVGTLTFSPGQPGVLGVEYRRLQAMSWYMAHRVHAALASSDAWLGFNTKYQIKYPSYILDGTAWNIGIPTIYMREDGWSSFTLLHEMGHIWQYMHKSGWGWNVVYDAAHGLSTHNCQESVNVAFLEGWAEFFQRHIRNEIPEWFHFTGWNRPRSFQWLNNPPVCDDEGAPGLVTPARLVRNDDGVIHALDLLIADNFYNRDFLLNSNWSGWDSTPLDPACNYFVFNDLDFIDVMKTFRASPAHGYYSHFSNSVGVGMEAFHERFRRVNMMTVQFANDRKQYWDTSTVNNPNQICHDVCQPDVSWWDGSSNDAYFDGANCYIDPVPAGKTGFVSGDKYFVNYHPTCPLGSYDSANCYLGTPAAGTTPFIYEGNMYTTPLPGNVCPLGSYDGANCYIGTPAAGTTPFIYEGNMYTTPLPGCSVGTWTSTGCMMGIAPAGRTPFIYAGNFYYSSS